MPLVETIKGWGLGFLIALVVLLLCVVLAVIDKSLSGPLTLLLIGLLALARLL